jgi:hypothetical protein
LPEVHHQTHDDASLQKLNIVETQNLASGVTPSIVTLEAGDGYFKKASYSIKYSKESYEDKWQVLEPKLDPWYYGNLLIGGFIGFLIVDPISGAMYKFPDQVNISLNENDAI